MALLRHARYWILGCCRTLTNCRYTSRASLPDLKYGQDLFNYTRGRLVCNAKHEMSQRHVRINVNELARCAVEAVGAKTCVSIAKCPDGMYNKSMLLTMGDGSRVVAKVPNPNAGLPHFTTASEVATRDFVRNILHIPVPKVLSWYSQTHENSVSTEYIIMEEVTGIQLEQVWPNVSIQDRFAIVKSIVGFQKAWKSVSFKKYGSLYFSSCLEDTPRGLPLYLNANGEQVTNEDLPLDLRQHAKNLIAEEVPSTLTVDHISSTHLWHDDLHVANIFVDAEEHTKIVGLIDWQSTNTSPLYFHAHQPHMINYDGPPINGLERPQKRNDLAELTPSERQRATALYLQQSLCSPYNTLTHRQNPQLYAALEFQQAQKYLLLLLARNLLIDGEASYLAHVAELEATLNEFLGDDGSNFPLIFSAEEREELEADVEGAARGMDAMSSIKESLGELFLEQGIVRHEDYEEALDVLTQMKEQVIDASAPNAAEREAWEKAWPFGT